MMPAPRFPALTVVVLIIWGLTALLSAYLTGLSSSIRSGLVFAFTTVWLVAGIVGVLRTRLPNLQAAGIASLVGGGLLLIASITAPSTSIVQLVVSTPLVLLVMAGIFALLDDANYRAYREHRQKLWVAAMNDKLAEPPMARIRRS